MGAPPHIRWQKPALVCRKHAYFFFGWSLVVMLYYNFRALTSLRLWNLGQLSCTTTRAIEYCNLLTIEDDKRTFEMFFCSANYYLKSLQKFKIAFQLSCGSFVQSYLSSNTQRGFRRQIETFQFNRKAALKKVATTALRKQTWTKDQNEKKVGDDSVFLFFPLLLLIPIIHSATFYTCIVWDKPRHTAFGLLKKNGNCEEAYKLENWC